MAHVEIILKHHETQIEVNASPPFYNPVELMWGNNDQAHPYLEPSELLGMQAAMELSATRSLESLGKSLRRRIHRILVKQGQIHSSYSLQRISDVSTYDRLIKSESPDFDMTGFDENCMKFQRIKMLQPQSR